MSNVISSNALAKIAISKNLIKEYKTSDSDRTVFLDNGTEFQIYLKNPYPYHVAVKILMNDKSIGSNSLVLRPGESIWLDRYLNNDSRFLFSTYTVDDTPMMNYATSKNGKVRIQFYKEKESYSSYCSSSYDSSYCSSITLNSSPKSYCNTVSVPIASSSIANMAFDYCCDTLDDSSTDIKGINTDCCLNISGSIDIDRNATAKVYNTNQVETGRIEKGSKSDQKFETCDINFESWAFKTEDILILPNSRKQIHKEDTRRKYCNQCGSKVSPKDKFCSNCGNKLQ